MATNHPKEFLLTEQQIKNFLTKVPPAPYGDECIEWPLYRSPRGYGRVQVVCDGKPHIFNAHRVSYHVLVSPIPDGLWVLHKCDNPPCFNPNHLFLGTCQDNIADRNAKGRQSKGPAHAELRRLTAHRGDEHHLRKNPELIPRGDAHWCKRNPEKIVIKGERNANAKLTDDAVRAIRFEYMNGVSVAAMSNKYGVAKKNIYSVIRKRSWKHIE